MRILPGWLSVCVLLTVAESVPAELPETIWCRVFAGQGSEVGYGIEGTPDGGFIVAGYTDSYGPGDKDGYLIRLTAAGDTLWTRLCGGARDDNLRCVHVTTDGGFVAAGTTESGGSGYEDVWLLRTDEDGNTLWSRTYGGTSSDHGWSVRETRDGGFVIVGHTCSFGGCDWDAWLIRTDQGGKEVWRRVFPGYSDYWDYARDVLEDKDGGFLVVGETAMGGLGEYDILLIKVSTGGDILWTKTYPREGEQSGQSMCATQDGGYVIAGRNYDWRALTSSIQLLKVSQAGDPLWLQVYAMADNAGGHCVYETADGDLVVAGHSGTWSDPDAYLLKTDALGEPVWEGSIAAAGRDFAYAVCPAQGGGYGLLVTTAPPTTPVQPSDLWVLRLDGEFSRVDEILAAPPTALVLGPVLPSPVHEEATVLLQAPAGDPAVLSLYDVSGRLVRCLWRGAGAKRPEQVKLSRQGLSSGVYFLRLQAGARTVTRRVSLGG